jgi:hypothetical protein
MDELLSGSMPSWLNTAATAVGPLIALLVGFVGADQWLRWVHNGKYLRTGEGRRRGNPLPDVKGLTTDSAPAGSIQSRLV